MEQFYLDNAERYKKLVAAFKPAPSPSKPGPATDPNPEMVVSARVRPMLDHEIGQGFPEGVHIRGNTNVVDVHELQQPVRGLPKLRSFDYTVDKLYGPEATTDQIYEDLVKPLVPWAWDGGIGTMFAYGQTSSGKTLTVSGLERLVAETLMNGSLEGERTISLSIIELAGQTAYDLLNNRKQISILEDSFGVTQMAGAIEHQVMDQTTFLQHIEAAAALRRTSPTLRNDSSSRSHAICRVRLGNPTQPAAKDGMLYLIDLAGSEAARDKVTHDTTRMKEAREINSSLSVLKDCIRGRALADVAAATGTFTADGKGKAKSAAPAPYVPFRQSTLTKTLKHVFDASSGRQCKTVVVACVNPCLADVGASRNTLRYAEMLRVPVPRAKSAAYQPGVPATWNNAQLREWIARNSGTPRINPALLAPTETGPQLLRLPAADFIARCFTSSSDQTTPDRAQAFHAKLWKLHIDSQQQRQPASNADAAAAAAATDNFNGFNGYSSVDPDPNAAGIPFRERIRPGMVVAWDPAKVVEYAGFAVAGAGGGGVKGYAMVLCPLSAFAGPSSSSSPWKGTVRDVKGEVVVGGNKGVSGALAVGDDGVQGDDSGSRGDGVGDRYLCALVVPAVFPGSFGIAVWQQMVLGSKQMEEEVLMEWDEATRYYYMTV
ncbi:P-loop containing nucleoside triphosphate hydrolase protein [Dichotomopilus funicola]|uniref:Kinesin-like protein n=1 Tax=Dichotomopilus funicola TaxID=1934379 RepID=A0AAN6UZU1_9PEZI|nr:P-loop containing nucleoside triphosphate hydrolase protein [Dichotomopilus funicola]